MGRIIQKSRRVQDTELLRDLSDPRRYITIDRWDSADHYELFLLQWETEYAELDTHCGGLAENEFLSGKGDLISSETR